jgi:hypothetical protein
MRYFTRELCDGDLPDDVYESRFTDYEQYLRFNLERMPESIRRLATEVPLHDAKVIALEYRTADVVVDLRLRSGDLQQGYFDVHLIYRDVSWFEAMPSMDVVVKGNETELLYDEVAILDTEFQHSMIFDPAGSFGCAFEASQ